MAEIKLTQGKVALIDDEDMERCRVHKWYAHRTGTTWYARTHSRLQSGQRYTLRLHRFLTGAPKGVKVDHCDGNGLNCRRLNIRLATTAQNGANRSKPPGRATSQFKGVSKKKPSFRWRHPKWQAQICVNQKQIYLGSFSSEREAAQAYDCAALIYFGEFARGNFMKAWGWEGRP